MSLLRPIHHTFGPLADRRQRRLAWLYLKHPQRASGQRELLRSALSHAFRADAFLFASGREALLAVLRSPVFSPDDEVILPTYTCVVLPNAIRAAGLTPVYCDIEQAHLNLDPDALERTITPRTKAIICQHTFGIPAPIERIREICDRRGILLIEDCAHVIPDDRGPADIGRIGDILLLSFGRDKALSGVTGGAVLCRKRSLCEAIAKREAEALPLPASVVRRLLLYPSIYAWTRPLYGMGLGKALLALARRAHLLVPILTQEEKGGHQDPVLHRLPDACAGLALDQWKQLREINDSRRERTRQYLAAAAERGWSVLHGIPADAPLQKFPLFVKDAFRLRSLLKRRNIHLDDGWTGCVVCPASADPAKTGYREGADPNAEALCEGILSLPTHPGTRESDAEFLIATLTELLRD